MRVKRKLKGVKSIMKRIGRRLLGIIMALVMAGSCSVGIAVTASAEPKYDNSWYKDLVVYQIWCRSFKDSNGDGIGDLNGVYQELDYLKSLGVNCIWFSPIYPSPQADYGYDVSDYYGINPEYGTMKDFDRLLNACHKKGIKVIMDLVINHTSDECRWFQESKKGDNNPYHDWYFWRKGKVVNGKRQPPNNWDSMFEGKAWEYDPKQDEYYLHLFSKKQPDLNMDNPEVRNEVKKIMRFWLNKGVDGFREDSITMISKDEGLPDGVPLPAATGVEHYFQGPHFQEYMQEFQHDVLDNYNCFTVGETGISTPTSAIRYTTGNYKILDMLITFDHMGADSLFTDKIPTVFNLPYLKTCYTVWQQRLYGKAWYCLYLENHDHARIISRYGSEKYWKESGKTLATMYMCLTGTPFIYQGQEIGMLNYPYKHMSELKDVSTINDYNTYKSLGLSEDQYVEKVVDRVSRENARTPVQWDSTANAGFTTGTPWNVVNPNYPTINVEAEKKDPDSILNYYRKLVAVRQKTPALSKGKYQIFYPTSTKIYCYEKTYQGQKALVICSFSDKNYEFLAPDGYDLTKGDLVLHNYKDAPSSAKSCKLRPYECRVYLYNS